MNSRRAKLLAVDRVRKPVHRATEEELASFHREFFLPLVWRVTWKHGIPKEDAKDLVQEAFLLALLKLRSDGSPRAWLTQVVDHLSSNYVRKAQRRTRLARQWLGRDFPFENPDDLRDPQE